MLRNTVYSRAKKLLFLASGVILLGTSCSHDIQQQLVAAGLQFVKQSAGDLLTTAFPVHNILTGNQ
jgi:hypothetical protein